jgi:hypothetical protein
MQTECRNEKLEVQAPEHAPIVAEFNGGTIISNAGVLLLKRRFPRTEIDQHLSADFAIFQANSANST